MIWMFALYQQPKMEGSLQGAYYRVQMDARFWSVKEEEGTNTHENYIMWERLGQS